MGEFQLNGMTNDTTGESVAASSSIRCSMISRNIIETLASMRNGCEVEWLPSALPPARICFASFR